MTRYWLRDNWWLLIAVILVIVLACLMGWKLYPISRDGAETQTTQNETNVSQTVTSDNTSQEIDFKVGDSVNGKEIRLNTGLVLSWSAIRNSTYPGKVVDGHVYEQNVSDDVLLGINDGYNTYRLVQNGALDQISALPNGAGIPFKQGDTVSGSVIVIKGSNAVYRSSAIRNSSVEGIIYSGAKWLKGITDDGIASRRLKLVDPAVDKPDDYYDGRKAYDTIGSANDTVEFKAGDTVYGYRVTLNGKTYYWAGIENSPYPGTVSYGRVFPKYSGVYWLKNLNIDLRVIDPRTVQPWPRKSATVCLNNDEALNGLPFEAGDAVLGDLTFYLPNGSSKHFNYAFILSSPYKGVVKLSGDDMAILNPTEDEISRILTGKIGMKGSNATPTLIDPETL